MSFVVSFKNFQLKNESFDDSKDSQEIEEPKVEEPRIKEPRIKEPESPGNKLKGLINKKDKENNTNENKIFRNGNVLIFNNDDLKVYQKFLILEKLNINNKDSKYMVSEQKDNSIVVVKYDPYAKLDVKEFIIEMINYYKNNINESYSELKINGNKSFCIISNVRNEVLKKQIVNDLISLLKEKD